ncbi:MAG: iron uptake porin [Cyanobacteria bacterium P01_E01_bin.42]
MDKQFWTLQQLRSLAIALGIALTLVSTPTAIAMEPGVEEFLRQVEEYSDRYNNEDTNRTRNREVSDAVLFSDVPLNHWAYQAVKDLARKYDCLEEYPAHYLGDRVLTRYEFAAALNTCLLHIERAIAASTEDFLPRQDLETLQRLMQEFEAELDLTSRVDNLEGRLEWF